MRIGIFGGSFDPPHIGHLVVARAALEARGLDLLLLVPAARSPLKEEPPRAPGAARIRMLKAAVAGDPGFRVSDAEVRRGGEGPSYTVDTLAEVAAEHSGAGLTLLLGVDQWADFGRWHRPREILRRAELAVMARAGECPSEVLPALPDGPPPPFFEVPVPRIDISSTEIRRRIREGRSVRWLVPDPVRAILESEKLYL